MSPLVASLLLPLLLPSPVGSGTVGAGPAPVAAPVAARALAAFPPGLVVGGPATTGEVPAGRGVWPLDPRPVVVRGFEPPASAYGRGHRGVDLLGAVGRPVHTSLAGVVTFAAPLAGRGVVVVDHGAVRTTYEPVQASVRVGQHVGRGQVVGALRPGGSHCAPRTCLHWGLRRGATYLDPLVLVGGRPVRLLPSSP